MNAWFIHTFQTTIGWASSGHPSGRRSLGLLLPDAVLVEEDAHRPIEAQAHLLEELGGDADLAPAAVGVRGIADRAVRLGVRLLVVRAAGLRHGTTRPSFTLKYSLKKDRYRSWTGVAEPKTSRRAFVKPGGPGPCARRARGEVLEE
jgi:hypothetical protein